MRFRVLPRSWLPWRREVGRRVIPQSENRERQVPQPQPPRARAAASSPSGLRFLSDAELDELPDPEWLVEGMLPANGLLEMFGAPGHGKTFVALDIALHVASGREWAGRKVKQGTVVYVAAEGSAGLKKRRRAWKEARRVSNIESIRYLPYAVQLNSASQVAELLGALKELPRPLVLVVIDTLARSMVGSDENLTKDVGLVVDACDRIRRETGAAVMLIHHTGRADKTHGRGSSALDGAADTIMALEKKSTGPVLSCEKQKEAEPFEPIKLSLVPSLDSLTVEVVGVQPLKERASQQLSALKENDRKTLRALASFDDNGATHGEWKKASRLTKSTFNRSIVRLNGHVIHDSETKRYRVAPQVRDALSPSPT